MYKIPFIFSSLFLAAACNPMIHPNLPAVDVAESNTPSSFENVSSQDVTLQITTDLFSWPIDRAEERITKKPFGLEVSPKNSPVSPEKFSGFHTATDFEIFSGEENAEIVITAVCDGTVVYKKTVNGYGGVLIQSCVLDDKPVTILYGHIKLDSTMLKIGDQVSAGGRIAILGKGYSNETSGERKHLHLGIHAGAAIELRGYVSKQTDLNNWFDPAVVISER